jgi:hypothetical protein
MSRAASFVGRFAAIRVKWLICFACFTAGWVACAAWVAVIVAAPQVALGLIQQVSGVL